MSSFSQPAESLPAAPAGPPRAQASADPASGPSWVEIAVIVVALLALAVLRWCSVYSHRWNTDEPQHLHVVWAWTVGKLQYRDIFDNHTPLFHILNAPLLRWLGERADIVLLMRRAMMPLFAVSIWCVYRLAVTIYDRRTGWFAALLSAFIPAYFFRMGEFRTDVMWTAVWLLALVVGIIGRMGPGRIFAMALLLGTAFAVSMKTTLLVLCLAVAGLITWFLAGRPVAKAWPSYVLAFVGGLVVVPGIIVAYFASQGALKPLYHCVIEHNTMPGKDLGAGIRHQLVSTSMLWLLPVGLCTAWMLPSIRRDPQRGYRRLFLFLVTGLFYSLLRGFWPVVTTQDYLPWLPLVPIFAVATCTWAVEELPKLRPTKIPWMLILSPVLAVLLVWLLTSDVPAAGLPAKRLAYLAVLLPIYLIGFFTWLYGRLQNSESASTVPWLLLPVLLLAGEIVYIVSDEPPFANVEAKRIAHLGALLRLADPGEYVLDTKGETIYRPRPTYLVLETLTRDQLQNGRLEDDTIPRLILTRTAVVRLSDRMMPATQRFVEDNYLRVNGGRVLGKRFQTVPNTPVSFEIEIPERYGVVSPSGGVAGTLDGQPIDGPRWLDAGRHELVVTHRGGEISLLWARALERGYSPYAALEPRSAD